jgi:hypothetical protein
MEDNMIVTPAVKEYISKFNIETVLNKMVNDILIKLPDDPFSEMCTIINEVRIY